MDTKEIKICKNPSCNNSFESYICINKKYCSRNCYYSSRKGKIFGRVNLEVAAILSGEKEAPFCKCNCGNRVKVKKYHRYYGIPQYILGHTSRNGKRKGKNNFNWQGGVSKFPYPFDFNEELKELIRKRDNYTCQLCGKIQEEDDRKLDVHHIDYIKENLDPVNLVSLCRSCNVKVNYSRKYWTEFFKLKLKLVS